MNENKIDENLTPVPRDDALALMFVYGERFQNGKQSADIASYKWNGRHVVEFNGYEIDSDVIVTDIPQLYRNGEGRFSNIQNTLFKEKPPKETVFCKAIIFASQKHDNAKRKGTEIPYIYHPMEAMQILKDNGCSDNAIIAGVLHDVLEDTKTTPEEILNQFGEEILKIVIAESEDKTKTWKERKQATIDHLQSSSLEVKLVCCADKLSNIRAMFWDTVTIGDKLWERFNAEKKEIQWYYTSIASVLSELSNYEMYKELVNLIKEVFDSN